MMRTVVFREADESESICIVIKDIWDCFEAQNILTAFIWNVRTALVNSSVIHLVLDARDILSGERPT